MMIVIANFDGSMKRSGKENVFLEKSRGKLASST